jgi:8-oxo-dGTP pyrophosphatase MutT (NUDIX family)
VLICKGENIGDAAVREVFEETNVKSEFQFLISLRHTHHGMFNCSDIYFVVGLKPTSEDINKCNREIAACEWMKVF